MQDCVFCKIIRGEIPSQKVYEDEVFLVFKDIKPSAPIHFLIVPKEHFKDITEASDAIWIQIKKVAVNLAKERNLKGFRLTTNIGDTALIDHAHVHFLAGITKDHKI